MILASLRFESPWWLAAFAALGVLAWLRGRSGPAAAVTFSSIALLGNGVRSVARRPGRWLAGLRLVALSLLVLALARPQTEKAERREDTRGINLMLALDFSGTMRTRDFLLDGRPVARADGMKLLSAEFIRARPNDRVGVVAFDREAYLASPLTLDHEWVLERLRFETNGTGTAVGSALAVAARHLQQHSNETRVIVLMTDAENLSAGPDPEQVAEALRPLGIRIHCIQILSPDQRQPLADLGELFTHVATRTGGEFFRVRSGADLRAVYAAIDRLEKRKLTDVRQQSWRELFPWFALPALGLLLAEQLLGHTRWRRLP
jgi:Ca-activated chloride channel family protein